MKTYEKDGKYVTRLEETDRRILSEVVRLCKNRIKLRELGWYRTIDAEQLWQNLVGQVCVMGSARPLEKLHQDRERRAEFENAISLERLQHQNDKEEYLARTLQAFKCTS
jgi:hypothetical protein